MLAADYPNSRSADSVIIRFNFCLQIPLYLLQTDKVFELYINVPKSGHSKINLSTFKLSLASTDTQIAVDRYRCTFDKEVYRALYKFALIHIFQSFSFT